MTIEAYGSNAGGWNPSDLADMGLGDVTASDMRMPQIVIDHEEAKFKNTTTGEVMDELEAVFLGLVKQRLMWAATVDDDDKPLCKAPDAETGYPIMRTDIPVPKQFPWDKSNFVKADQAINEDGFVQLPCNTCIFKDWGKNNERPACSEVYTFPIYYRVAGGPWAPAMISFQRSGAKAARTYAGSFASKKTPMFTAITRVTLTPLSRGKNKYATPSFSAIGTADPEEYGEYINSYRQSRDFLHRPPMNFDKKPAPPSAAASTALDEDDPWADKPSTESSSAPSAADDDDLPFF